MFKEIINAILPNILEIVATIISLIVARYVVPYVKTDLIPWLKERHLYNTIKNFVQAVEKLAESGVLEKTYKKQKVVELLENKGIIVDETVEAFIESAVKELDMVATVAYEEILKSE